MTAVCVSLCRKCEQRVFVWVNHNVLVMVGWCVGMMEMKCDVNSRDDTPFLTLLKALGCPMLEKCVRSVISRINGEQIQICSLL